MKLLGTLLKTMLITVTALLTAHLAPLAQAAPPSATIGLFGSADATYNGVFRQSLSIMGLLSAGVKPDSAAVLWLVNQQCQDGSFQALRTDLSSPCNASDPANYSGPDTNSTALAALALTQVGSSRLAGQAIAWLGRQQLANGGWPMYSGGSADANSTGLVLSALRVHPTSASGAWTAKALAYLNAVSLPCSKGSGALPYQVGGPANISASAQGLLGLSGYRAGQGTKNLAADPRCAGAAVNRVSSYLVGSLNQDGLLPNAMGQEPDYDSTASMVLGLVARGIGKSAVAIATQALYRTTPAFTMKDGVSQPGPLGVLLLVAKATGSNPRDFGGVDLVRTLEKSERR